MEKLSIEYIPNKNYCVYEHIFPNGKKYMARKAGTQIEKQGI